MAKTVTMKKRSSRWPSYVALCGLVAMTWWAVEAIRLAKVPSGSMEPTLMPGDVVAMRIDAYRHRSPLRGDIVIFHDPTHAGELLIKRVVGLPGEDIVVQGGSVWVNGHYLQEPYIRMPYISAEMENRLLHDNEFWVMGDNRTNSADSRDYGPIKQDELVARGTGIIWPLSRRTKLLGYGDRGSHQE